MKVCTTKLSEQSVIIEVATDFGDVTLDLPVNIISPVISMQIAGMITSDRMMPYDLNKEA